MNHSINDSFMNPDRFGYTVIPFKLDGNKEPPKHVPEWRIRRSEARSMGKQSFTGKTPCNDCGSIEKRVYNLACYVCFKVSKKK